MPLLVIQVTLKNTKTGKVAVFPLDLSSEFASTNPIVPLDKVDINFKRDIAPHLQKIGII